MSEPASGPSRRAQRKRKRRRSGDSGVADHGVAHKSNILDGDVRAPPSTTKEHRSKSKSQKPKVKKLHPANSRLSRAIIAKARAMDPHALHVLNYANCDPAEIAACAECQKRAGVEARLARVRAGTLARHGVKTRVAALRRRDGTSGVTPPEPGPVAHSAVAWRIAKRKGRPLPSTLGPNREKEKEAREARAKVVKERVGRALGAARKEAKGRGEAMRRAMKRGVGEGGAEVGVGRGGEGGEEGETGECGELEQGSAELPLEVRNGVPRELHGDNDDYEPDEYAEFTAEYDLGSDPLADPNLDAAHDAVASHNPLEPLEPSSDDLPTGPREQVPVSKVRTRSVARLQHLERMDVDDHSDGDSGAHVSWELDEDDMAAEIADLHEDERVARDFEAAARARLKGKGRSRPNDNDDDDSIGELTFSASTRNKLSWQTRKRDARLASGLMEYISAKKEAEAEEADSGSHQPVAGPSRLRAQPPPRDSSSRAQSTKTATGAPLDSEQNRQRKIPLPHPFVMHAIQEYATHFFAEQGALQAPHVPKRPPRRTKKRAELEDAGVWDDYDEEEKEEEKRKRGPYVARNMYQAFDGKALLAMAIFFEEIVHYQLLQYGWQPRSEIPKNLRNPPGPTPDPRRPQRVYWDGDEPEPVRRRTTRNSKKTASEVQETSGQVGSDVQESTQSAHESAAEGLKPTETGEEGRRLVHFADSADEYDDEDEAERMVETVVLDDSSDEDNPSPDPRHRPPNEAQRAALLAVQASQRASQRASQQSQQTPRASQMDEESDESDGEGMDDDIAALARRSTSNSGSE